MRTDRAPSFTPFNVTVDRPFTCPVSVAHDLQQENGGRLLFQSQGSIQMVRSRFSTEAECVAGPPLWRGRRDTPDGEAIRGGVHGAASRACEKIRMKDF